MIDPIMRLTPQFRSLLFHKDRHTSSTYDPAYIELTRFKFREFRKYCIDVPLMIVWKMGFPDKGGFNV